MIHGGYLIKPRKIFDADSTMMNAPPLWWKLWDWMVASANYKNHGDLHRGQLFTSIDDMRDAMSWRVGYRIDKPTKGQIRTCYLAFVNEGMITVAKTTRGIIITVVKYAEYQDIKSYDSSTQVGPTVPAPVIKPEIKPESTLVSQLMLLHREMFDTVMIAPGHLVKFKQWSAEGKSFADIEQAYIKTASTRTPARRWDWIIDQIDNAGGKQRERYSKKQNTGVAKQAVNTGGDWAGDMQNGIENPPEWMV
jgi:hypothetical protein